MSKRKPTKILPPVEYLRECFSYDPQTGILRWLLRPIAHFSGTRQWKRWNSRYAKMVAGMIDDRGYRRVRLDRSRYKAHRLIWRWMTGDEEETIDHIDGVCSNNTWRNLRAATQQQQTFNARLQKNNPSGHRGVDLRGKKWRAYITHNGIRHELGRFNSVDEAAIAQERAARNFHGEFFREA